MCAKFGCGPTVVSKKKGGGTDRQTDRQRKLQLYIVDYAVLFECINILLSTSVHVYSDSRAHAHMTHYIVIHNTHNTLHQELA